MRLVERPHMRPMHCAAVPFIGQTHPDTRWVDTGTDFGFDNDRVYLSDHAVRDAAKLLGFPSEEDHEALLEEVKALRARVEELDSELNEAQRVVDAIDAIESADFRARKKAGRPKKEPATA